MTLDSLMAHAAAQLTPHDTEHHCSMTTITIIRPLLHCVTLAEGSCHFVHTNQNTPCYTARLLSNSSFKLVTTRNIQAKYSQVCKIRWSVKVLLMHAASTLLLRLQLLLGQP